MFPRVKEVLISYETGGILNVINYFGQKEMQIDPSTWAGRIKKSIDDGHTISTSMEIELLIEKFKLNKNVSKKEGN